ncbi:magnesium-protoporphyrin IX monomethyl ester anaerobic oxidative cyclase [Flavobacterium silvaticum]|uniref:Magnesium-protoporphyrin IX monomethyl ester anaerobic oxidative cyclase n=1 Tax=Flavobacterium silvaticum TaxID=1852020 RepID=A0A972FNN9_9FLAO|nr:magnesium-protoporphyrin IX monomethyl ester anaerobic oxidative cyclase [Flavobacterium silvaticum]NMH29394.1 magnesium-protoporphyrin IX monomethyl ester anaerobic oxidative cyclase [Flavobacterium silvaticum]
MKILIVNPPHLSIGSRLAGEHLPPLGLLSIGGPLIDSGHEVSLLDSDYFNDSIPSVVQKIKEVNPEVLLMGHSGSTSAQPVIEDISRMVKLRNPELKIIIGGVFPTYHWKEILQKNESIDYIVCGEGEETITKLVSAIEQQSELNDIRGIAYRNSREIIKMPPAATIKSLDDFRIGWELMDGYHYTYWGKRKAVVIQFSRGCPYPCTYCGQSLFWKKWRHRSAKSLVDEMEMLHKKMGVIVFNFADENPSSNPKAWREFLQELVSRNLKLILVASIRADNIVRDADYLHLYKKAGFERFLLGIENYDEAILENIKKAGEISKDKEAIQLLRQHNILSMATYVVGFGEEKPRDFYNSLKQLLSYDPDQVQLLYATPHKWTPYFEEVRDKEIILTDQRKWDYKHQVISTRFVKPWLVILFVKAIEIFMQTRPKALIRLFFHRDARLRSAMRWYSRIGKRVWFWELHQFFFVTPLSKERMKMKDFWA